MIAALYRGIPMRRLLVCLVAVILLSGSIAALAQQELLADYAIRSPRPAQFSADSVIIQFDLVSVGAPAAQPAIVELRFAATNAVITSFQQPPLASGASTTITFTVPLAQFATVPSPLVSLCLITYFTAPPQCSTSDNSVLPYTFALPTSVVVPGSSQPIPTLSPNLILPDGSGSTLSSSGSAASLTRIGDFELPFGLDLYNPLHVAIVIGAAGLLLIILWLLTVILRLVFGRERTFPSWQPPYGVSATINPNSTAGRRQLWQQHAMADTLPVPCTGGDYMARKILIGMNGEKLKNWRVTAARISQYDMYGRVTRTQTLLSNRVIKPLDAAVRRSGKMTPKRAMRTAKPIARRIMREFKGKLKRTPTLPISLDLRFRGNHGDIRIVFELFQCLDGQSWNLIDQWEPEMQVISSHMQENFTYALYGQRSTEKRGAFHKRLTADIANVISAMIQQPPPVPPPAPSAPARSIMETDISLGPIFGEATAPSYAQYMPPGPASDNLFDFGPDAPAIPAPENEPPLIKGDTSPIRPVDPSDYRTGDPARPAQSTPPPITPPSAPPTAVTVPGEPIPPSDDRQPPTPPDDPSI